MVAPHPLVVDDNKRLVAGWASVEVKDLVGDIIPVEVLERAMYDYMSRGGVVMLHHTNFPVGKVVRWEIKEHPETKRPGLWVEVEVFTGSQIADEAWKQIKSNELKGFSVSGVGIEDKNKEVEIGGQKITADVISQLELAEISLVSEPANPLAKIEYVNIYAKSQDMSLCLDKLGNADVCKWIVSVYRQYGFDSIEQAINELVKDTGAITTQTPGMFNPMYGDNPEHQMPVNGTKVDEVVGQLTDKRDEEVEPTEQDSEADKEPQITTEPLPPSPETPISPPPEPELPKDLVDRIKQLIAELRELINDYKGRLNKSLDAMCLDWCRAEGYEDCYSICADMDMTFKKAIEETLTRLTEQVLTELQGIIDKLKEALDTEDAEQIKQFLSELVDVLAQLTEPQDLKNGIIAIAEVAGMDKDKIGQIEALLDEAFEYELVLEEVRRFLVSLADANKASREVRL